MRLSELLNATPDTFKECKFRVFDQKSGDDVYDGEPMHELLYGDNAPTCLDDAMYNSVCADAWSDRALLLVKYGSRKVKEFFEAENGFISIVI